MTDELERPIIPSVGDSISSLDEASQGSFNPADEVMERPALPVAGPDLQQPVQLDDEVFLQGEHLFGSSPLFEGLTPEEIREIVRASERLQLQTGDLLFVQDDVAEAVYILQSGELQVRANSPMGEDIVLAMLGPGTVVGELALIDGGPRSATVESLSNCAVYRLSRADFNNLKAQFRPAAYKVILNLAKTVDARRRQAERRIAEVFDDPEQHIDLFESQVHDMLAKMRKI